MVNETDLGVLGPNVLWYEDVESPGYDVLYTITAQPYFQDSSVTTDAGRLILANASVRQSDARAAASSFIRSFTQQDLNDGRVMYVPPVDDVGFADRTASMIFAVSDGYGSSTIDQQLEIVVLSVNDQVPEVETKPLRVAQGGNVRLTSDAILINDSDTHARDLRFALKTEPRHGQLTIDGVTVAVDEKYALDDLKKFHFR